MAKHGQFSYRACPQCVADALVVVTNCLLFQLAAAEEVAAENRGRADRLEAYLDKETREIARLKADLVFQENVQARDAGEITRLLREVARLKEEIEDGNSVYRSVMEEACAGGITYDTDDRQHCTCVPHLREGVARLRAARDGALRMSDQFEAENARLRNDLADALDLKSGHGPTALTMLAEDRARLRAALTFIVNHSDARYSYSTPESTRLQDIWTSATQALRAGGES